MLELYDIETGYGAGQVLFGVSLSVASGACVSLMGRNGMGKTTTIRAIMGQLPLSAGRISRFGDDRSGRPSFDIARSGIGLVPEGRQIFSNLSVRENLQTFFRPSSDPTLTSWTYDRVLALFPRLAERSEHAGNHLSGGQQQRVAVARALVLEPQVLLFDEPLSNLDAKLRRSVRNEIRDLQQKLGLTVVYVTHDQEEALAVSDKIIVMNKGQIAQIGTPHELYESPSDLFVANFIGESNIIDCKIERISRGKATIRLGEQLLQVSAGELEAGPIKMVVRPEDVTLHVKKIKDSFAGVIETATYVGSKTEYQISTEAGSFFVTLPSRSKQYAAGTKIHLSVDPDAVRLFPVE